MISTKERKKKSYSVFKDKLEGTQYKLTTEIAQKSRDSMLLIGARVRQTVCAGMKEREGSKFEQH
jgi:hypothetical protein